MPLVKVGTKHQVVIPKAVRDKLGVHPGDYVEILFDRNQAVLKRKKIVDDFPHTTEAIGPKTKARIREGLEDIEEGRVGPELGSKKKLRGYLDDLKKK